MTNKEIAERQERRAVTLAGGEGLRLLSLTRRISGRDVPKQFCPIFGSATLLEQTRRRVSLAFPSRALTTVVRRGHECFYEPLLADVPPESVLVQPVNRGTAPAILYALMKLAEVAPAATVSIFPSDHYVSDDKAFMSHVEQAIKVVKECPQTTVLLGATPTAPEIAYGWIEAGDPLALSDSAVSV